MYLHRECKSSIISGIFLVILSATIAYLLSIPFFIKALIFIPFLIIFLSILWFFRIPYRTPVLDEKFVIAPADGKIVVIEKTVEEEYFKDERIQISIFMSPFNIHQNIYPISGIVSYSCHQKGRYLVAWHPKSSTLNERSTIVIKQEDGTEILVRQIAGAVARRICTYSQAGKTVKQCDELGFIKFGSRVDIFLPLTADIKCQVNDLTTNMKTILAEI